MSKKKNKIPQDLQQWIEARKKHRLSHAQVQMARELGLNPRKLGKIDNHKQEPWKEPLPDYIETIYFRRFKKEKPERVQSIEDIVAKRRRQKEERRQRKAEQAAAGPDQGAEESPTSAGPDSGAV